METNQTQSKLRKTSPFRYGIGMFGTSIPINMFKTYAAIFYVDMLGLPMKQYSLVLLIYTFVDAIDNPVYGFCPIKPVPVGDAAVRGSLSACRC